MRLTTTLRTTLSAAAALALLTACGGGSDDETTAQGSSSSSSSVAAPSSSEESGGGDSEAAAFCSEAEGAFTDLQSAATNTDPSAIPSLLAQASERLGAIEPPAEISGPWATINEAISATAASIQGVDLNTPEGQQAFLTAVNDLQTNAGDAQAQVETYVTANCDVPTESASPTS